MAEALPLANDGFPLRFAFLVELIDILDRAPVGDVPHLAFPKEAVEHAATGEKTNVSFVERRHRPAGHLLLLTHKNAAGVLHCRGAL